MRLAFHGCYGGVDFPVHHLHASPRRSFALYRRQHDAAWRAAHIRRRGTAHTRARPSYGGGGERTTAGRDDLGRASLEFAEMAFVGSLLHYGRARLLSLMGTLRGWFSRVQANANRKPCHNMSLSGIPHFKTEIMRSSNHGPNCNLPNRSGKFSYKKNLTYQEKPAIDTCNSRSTCFIYSASMAYRAIFIPGLITVGRQSKNMIKIGLQTMPRQADNRAQERKIRDR